MAADGTLTDRELAAKRRAIVGAGLRDTVNLIGQRIALLLRHPEQLAYLRDDPALGRRPSRRSCDSTARSR